MRDSLGFINIEKLDHGDICFFRGYSHFYFTYNGVKYYFKKTFGVDTTYNELIAEEIAKEFGIPCLHYDLASYQDNTGVISEDFVKDNKLVLLSDLLTDDDQKNLSSINIVLMENYKDKHIVDGLMDELINLFMFDIIIGNSDRHTDNIGFIETKTGVHLTPAFDNDLMLSELAVHDGYYSLGINRADSEYQGHILEKFFHIFNQDHYRIFSEKVEIINPENMDRIIKRVEKRIGTEMNDVIKSKIKKEMFFHYNNLKKIVMNEKHFKRV